jgi:NAD(P)H-hydrate epimerase
MKIVNIEEMRQIEQATDGRGHSYAAMMDMAGRSVATLASALMLAEPESHALVLVGPGNNGGDGLVAAHYLLESEHEVSIYVWKRDTRGDENLKRLKRRRRGVAILWSDNDPDFTKLRAEVQKTDLVIDALLGTGATRPIEGRLAELLAVVREEVNVRRFVLPEEPLPPLLPIPRFPLMEAQALGLNMEPPGPPREPFDASDEDYEDWDEDDESDDDALDDEDDGDDAYEDDWDEDWEDEDEAGAIPTPPWPRPAILAVDCPSGLNCDTGALDPVTLRAEITVTFALPKWGQLEYPGAGYCGLLAVTDIGVPPDLADKVMTELVGPPDVRRWLPGRPPDAHKGTFGKVMIVAGSLNYTGAAYLSAAAAARSGAGLVTLAIPAPLHAILASILVEATWLPLPGPEGVHCVAGAPRLLQSLVGYGALLIGPGLTTSEDAQEFVKALFAADGLPAERWLSRTIVDADALNILAALPDWPGRLPPQSILTPHPGEMARLTGQTPEEINGQRIAATRRYAAQWGHIVLLKGAHTVIAAPDGRAAVLPFALPTLATAGSGDVLAGAIAGLVGQGLPPYEAALCGAYLHGQAGLLVTRSLGMSGGLASDLLSRLPEALRQLYVGS